MIDHLLFYRSFWIERTPEVQNKLDNFDRLQSFKNKLSKIDLEAWNKSGGQYIKASIQVNDDGTFKLLSKTGTFGDVIKINNNQIR
ncbi:hypothetical protein P5719_001390 [Lactobacillus amylovorus]|uniref:hypothetical protein n=1 Tax=Lactobacillus amylovorus TaxID=1604 RepID=UPI00313DD034|nr:hypothetical protein [Lactobacillus amylovorus]